MGSQSEMLVNATETLSDAQLAAVELFKDYPDTLINFATVCSVIFTLVGIPGNIITIVALARDKKVLNATAIFIISLSFSDLLSCCLLLPLAVSIYYHRAWVHGQFLCRIAPFTRFALVGNSLFTVFAITSNRYIMIAHPTLYTKIYKKRNIVMMLVCLWMVPFGTMIPIILEKFGRFGFDMSIGCCSILKDHNNRSPKGIIILTLFILPCLTIIICYLRIFCIVQKAKKKALNTKKLLPNPKDSSSFDVSTSFPVRDTAITNCNHGAEAIKITKNTNINSTNMKTSDNITNQPEEWTKESPRIYRTKLTKSIKYLKKVLPTQKDRRLGSIITALIVSFCLCNLPITIIKVAQKEKRNPILHIIADTLFNLSSCLNPIVYVVTSNEYRKAYTKLFKR